MYVCVCVCVCVRERERDEKASNKLVTTFTQEENLIRAPGC